MSREKESTSFSAGIMRIFPAHIYRSFLKTEILFVNKLAVKANYKIASGDVIHIRIPESEPLDILPENIPLEIFV